MKPKFQIGDIIACKDDSEYQYQIVDITKKFKKSIKGNWNSSSEEVLVDSNSYVTKDLENNKLSWGYVKVVEKYYQLFQQAKEKPLKWKNYQEILV